MTDSELMRSIFLSPNNKFRMSIMDQWIKQITDGKEMSPEVVIGAFRMLMHDPVVFTLGRDYFSFFGEGNPMFMVLKKNLNLYPNVQCQLSQMWEIKAHFKHIEQKAQTHICKGHETIHTASLYMRLSLLRDLAERFIKRGVAGEVHYALQTIAPMCDDNLFIYALVDACSDGLSLLTIPIV
jgi:hypothetical protein